METNIPFVIQGLLISFRFLRDAFLRGACLLMPSDNILINLEKPEFIPVEVKNDKVVERASYELISSSPNCSVSKRLVSLYESEPYLCGCDPF